MWTRPRAGTCPCATTSCRRLRRIGDHARKLGASHGVQLLSEDAELGTNDARWLREKQARERLLAEVVRQGALKFRGRG